jgi:hypothetical protein
VAAQPFCTRVPLEKENGTTMGIPARTFLAKKKVLLSAPPHAVTERKCLLSAWAFNTCRASCPAPTVNPSHPKKGAPTVTSAVANITNALRALSAPG